MQSHRLGYYPSPSYETYQNDADLYDDDYIYGEFVKFIMEHFYHVPSSKLEFNFELENIVRFEEHIAECDTDKSWIVV